MQCFTVRGKTISPGIAVHRDPFPRIECGNNVGSPESEKGHFDDEGPVHEKEIGMLRYVSIDGRLVLNCTPHSIDIYDADAVIKKNIGGRDRYIVVEGISPRHHIDASGIVLNCKLGSLSETGVFRKDQGFASVDPIPKGVGSNCILIVSNLYRSAYRSIYGWHSTLVTVGDPVYADDTSIRPVGCLCLYYS